MSSYFHKPIQDRISFSRMAIMNCIDNPELALPLGHKGYNSTRLQLGLDIVNSAEEAELIQSEEYGDQYGATKDADQYYAAITPAIDDFVELLKIRFEDETDVYTKLELHKPRIFIREGWTQQHRQLFKAVLADESIVEGMDEFDYDRDMITKLSESVNVLDEKNRVQNKETGEAQRATQRRDEKVQEMDTWMRRFMRVAKIAFREDSQLMEQLGIVVK